MLIKFENVIFFSGNQVGTDVGLLDDGACELGEDVVGRDEEGTVEGLLVVGQLEGLEEEGKLLGLLEVGFAEEGDEVGLLEDGCEVGLEELGNEVGHEKVGGMVGVNVGELCGKSCKAVRGSEFKIRPSLKM